jgi:ATP-dependent RNA helicase HelY
VVQSLEALRAGDVIRIQSGRRAGLAVVVDPGTSPIADPRPLVVTEDRWAGPVTPLDFPHAVEVLGRLPISKHFNHRSPAARKDVASSIRNLRIADQPARRRERNGAADDTELAGLRAALRAHPCHGCHDRDEHARWAERAGRLRRENDALRQRAEGRTHSLSRTFDQVCALLTERGYMSPAVQHGDTAVAGDATANGGATANGETAAIGDTAVTGNLGATGDTITKAGRQLSRIWSESDLLIAECLRSGAWSGLNAAELAGICSTMVYEARRDEPAAPKLPTGPLRDALRDTLRLWAEVSEHEGTHRLPLSREPDLGFVWASYRWAKGDSLDRVLNSMSDDGTGLPAGDFVRWMRQLLDLLEQLARADAIDPGIRATAAAACSALRRGVIAQQL